MLHVCETSDIHVATYIHVVAIDIDSMQVRISEVGGYIQSVKNIPLKC